MKREASALRVQKSQLSKTSAKTGELQSSMQKLKKEQDELDVRFSDTDQLLGEALADVDISLDIEFSDIDDILFALELEKMEVSKKDLIQAVELLDMVEIDENTSWEEYFDSVKLYAERNNINLEEDPFKHLMSKTEQQDFLKMINDDFTYKNAKCDKYDYMIAGTCGAIAGIIDVLFVGIPTDSKLGSFTDDQANKITEKFAEFFGWDKQKVVDKGDNTTSSAIGFLENKFRVNYDQATTHATGGAVKNLSMSNHHLKSLAHSPDIIGLFFSVLNQFTNTSSFISSGKIITIDTESFELQGGDFKSKVFCGVVNWFGHIMSDWAGSSGTVGQGGRGTGVPIPFYNLFQIINVGEFGQHRQTFATVTTKIFEQGYDFRHGTAMAIPVVINELLIRFMYTMKSRFYHNKSWKDSIPNASIPELRRMLLVGHGVLCLVDGADATIRSGGELVQTLLRTNLIAWVRFGHLTIKEVGAMWKVGEINSEAMEEHLDKELKEMIRIHSSIK